MQCCDDERGNSVPTILLMMQKQLYSEGGLQVCISYSDSILVNCYRTETINTHSSRLKAEGIFRINAENSKEEQVRKQLSTGFVPRGVDVHCLAGLIKVLKTSVLRH